MLNEHSDHVGRIWHLLGKILLPLQSASMGDIPSHWIGKNI
jgi:hypothetical protein